MKTVDHAKSPEFKILSQAPYEAKEIQCQPERADQDEFAIQSTFPESGINPHSDLEVKKFKDGERVQMTIGTFKKYLFDNQKVSGVSPSPTPFDSSMFKDAKISNNSIQNNDFPMKNKKINKVDDAGVYSTVYFDIQIGSAKVERITFELFDETPEISENFRQLCTGELGFGYKDSTFHKIIPSQMALGGDLTSSGETDNKSFVGGKLNDESFIYTHERAGLLSIGN